MEQTKKYWLNPETILDGRYVIKEVIGEGGFGITYKGIHKSIGMTVAIKEFFSKKFMKRNISESDSVVLAWDDDKDKFEKEKKKFLQEARIVSDFSKEDGVVHIMDYFEANETAYIVMEYIDGVNLKERINKSGPMSVESCIRKILPVINTLGKIHNCGVIHRDIGPNNIMVQSDDKFRLIDFGSAKDYEGIDEKSYSVILTGGYAPPEQYDKEGNLGPWTDVYAVCAVIYYCITGQSPQEALSRILYDEIEKPSEKGVKIKSETEKIILKGLSVNPKDRYQSMEELERVLSSQIKEKKEKSSNKKAIIAGISVALIAMLVSLGGFLGNRYYENHKEEIMFGDEEVQHLLLSAPDDMSAKQYADAKKILRERLKILTNDKYIMEEDDENIRISIARKVYTEEKLYKDDQNFSEFTKSLISRPCEIYLVDYKNNKMETAMDDLANSVKITNKDIQSVKNSQKKISDEKYDIEWMFSDGDTGDGNQIKNISKYHYGVLEIKLSDAVVEKLKNNNISGECYICQDANMKNVVLFCITGVLSEDRRTLYIHKGFKSEQIIELLKYNMTHKKFSKAFNVLGFDIETEWEETEKNASKGKNQVNQNEIKNPSISLYYTTYGEHTEGEWIDIFTDIRIKMDSLEIPYSLGKEKEHPNNIVIKMARKDCYYNFMDDAIFQSGGINIVSSFWEMSYFRNYQVDIEKSNGQYKLIFSTEKEYQQEELKEISEKILKNNEKYLWLRLGKYKIARATLTKPIEDGKIVFDKYYVNDEQYQKGNEPLFYSYVKNSITKTSDSFDSSFFLHNIYQENDEGKIIHENVNKLKGLKEVESTYSTDKNRIKKILPNALVHRSYIDELYVDIKVDDTSDEQIKDIMKKIKSVIDDGKLLDGRYDVIRFRFEEKNQYSVIAFRKDTVSCEYYKTVFYSNSTQLNKKLIRSIVAKDYNNIKWQN